MSYYLILKIPIEPDHYIDIKNNSYKKSKFGLYYKVYKSVISLTRPPQWNPPRSFNYQL